jgi:hypothetical protein
MGVEGKYATLGRCHCSYIYTGNSSESLLRSCRCRCTRRCTFHTLPPGVVGARLALIPAMVHALGVQTVCMGSSLTSCPSVTAYKPGALISAPRLERRATLCLRDDYQVVLTMIVIKHALSTLDLVSLPISSR